MGYNFNIHFPAHTDIIIIFFFLIQWDVFLEDAQRFPVVDTPIPSGDTVQHPPHPT